VRELKADKPRRPKKKSAPAANPRPPEASAPFHEPHRGPTILAKASRPSVAQLASEPAAVSIPTAARLFLLTTGALAVLLWAIAATPGRLLVNVSAGLKERRSSIAFAGLCVLTAGFLISTVVVMSG
jgi:hypothetical protein